MPRIARLAEWFQARGKRRERLPTYDEPSPAFIPTAGSFWASITKMSCTELKERLDSEEWIPAHREVLEREYRSRC